VVTGTLQILGKTVAAIEDALEAIPPGSDGLILFPFLNGERTPDLPTARGSLHGISATNFTPDHLIRAAVEGVSFGILNGLDLVLEGKQADVIQLIGGGDRSRAWRQLLADASGATIHVPAEEEAGCLGAAMQAVVAYSVQQGTPRTFVEVARQFVRLDEQATCNPRPVQRPAYDAAREQYKQLLHTYYKP